jgi:hypothetical protein
MRANLIRSCLLGGNLPLGTNPVGTREVAGISPRLLLEIIMMFRLCLPEVSDRLDLCDDLASPETGCIHVGYRFLGDAHLLVVDIVDRRTVRATDVSTLTVPGRRIVDLEEILQ